MKSIVYILIAVFISTILLSAFPKPKLENSKAITLLCTEKASDEEFNQSIEIITNRLKSFGLEGFEVEGKMKKMTILVSLKNDAEVNEIKPLLTSKGKLEFCETLSKDQLISKLGKEDKLFSLLSKEGKGTDAALGYSSKENKAKIDKYINSSLKDKLAKAELEFAWSKFPTEEAVWSLFLLNQENNLSGKYVSESVPSTDGESVMLSFSEKGSVLWKELTARNVNKPIAIVVDKEVYSAPLVRAAIEHGKCQISGNFSTSEVSRLVSIFENGELPLSFNLKE